MWKIEKYENGIFVGFNSKTNQNKKEKFVNITIDPKDKKLIIDGSSFNGKVNKDLIIGTWWNHEIVQKKAQISAVSGRIIEQKVEFKGKEDVKIGDKVWITTDVFIAPGVTIDNGCVVLARSTVLNDLPAWKIVGGYPAKIIKDRILKSL